MSPRAAGVVLFVAALALVAGTACAMRQASGVAAEGAPADSAAAQTSPSWILPLAPSGYGGPGVISPYSNVNPMNPMAAQMQAQAAGATSTGTPQTETGPAHNEATGNGNFLELWNAAAYGAESPRMNSIESLAGFINEKHEGKFGDAALTAPFPFLTEAGGVSTGRHDLPPLELPVMPAAPQPPAPFEAPRFRAKTEAADGCGDSCGTEFVKPEIAGDDMAASYQVSGEPVFVRPEHARPEFPCECSPDHKEVCRCSAEERKFVEPELKRNSDASDCGCRTLPNCPCEQKITTVAEEVVRKENPCACQEDDKKCECPKDPNHKTEFFPEVPHVDSCGHLEERHCPTAENCHCRRVLDWVAPEVKETPKPTCDCPAHIFTDGQCPCDQVARSPYVRAAIVDSALIESDAVLSLNKW